ncbi:unnamed protein product, partial [Effrenium voratum]
ASFSAALARAEFGLGWARALLLLRQAQHSARANEITLSSCISALRSQWQTALVLLGTTVQPNAVCYNSALSACDASGEPEMAVVLLQRMPSLRLHPDAGSFAAGISAMRNHWQRGLWLLATMEQSAVMAD